MEYKLPREIKKIFDSETPKIMSKKLQKKFGNQNMMTGEQYFKRPFYNFDDKLPYLGRCLIERFTQIEVAKSLNDIKILESANLHSLTQNRKGQLAIDLDTSSNRGKRRIVFKTLNGQNVVDDFRNEQAHKSVTIIEIIEVEDYHN